MATKSMRERIAKSAKGGSPPSEYDALVGARVISVSKKAAIVEIAVGDRVHNPTGVLHGGILSGLVDSAMAYAATAHLGEGETVTNIDLHIRFLRATVEGTLRAEAWPIRLGRTLIPMQAEVRDAAGELVATASSTFMRLNATRGAAWLPAGSARARRRR